MDPSPFQCPLQKNRHVYQNFSNKALLIGALIAERFSKVCPSYSTALRLFESMLQKSLRMYTQIGGVSEIWVFQTPSKCRTCAPSVVVLIALACYVYGGASHIQVTETPPNVAHMLQTLSCSIVLLFYGGGSEILVFETTPPNVARAFQTLPCPSLLPVRFIGGVWGGQVAEIPPNVAHMRSKHSRAHRPHLCCLLGVSRKPGFSRRPQMLHMRSKHCRAHRSCLLCLLRGCLGNSGCRDTPRLFHTCDPNIAVLIALARVVYWGGVSET